MGRQIIAVIGAPGRGKNLRHSGTNDRHRHSRQSRIRSGHRVQNDRHKPRRVLGVLGVPHGGGPLRSRASNGVSL